VGTFSGDLLLRHVHHAVPIVLEQFTQTPSSQWRLVRSPVIKNAGVLLERRACCKSEDKLRQEITAPLMLAAPCNTSATALLMLDPAWCRSSHLT
jgi:hypothetical protein